MSVTKEQLLEASSFGVRNQKKGVITTKEANDRINRFNSIITISSLKHGVFFFSDDHCFGVGVLEMKKAGFVPCTSQMPHLIKERPAFPEGILHTAEEYKEVFEVGFVDENGKQPIHRQIESVDELVEFLNNL